MGKNHSKRIKKKTNGELVVEECLNPKAKNVTYNYLHIGGTTYEAGAQPSTSKIHNKKDEDDDVRTSKHDTEVAAITSTLKNLYEKIALPSLPWIQEPYMSMNYFTKLQLNSDTEQSTTKDIDLHNLFDAVNKKNPRRILIEALPGFGKTTLSHKIISDWVNEESYVKRFKFAFLIILRNYESSTLKDEIFEIIGVGNDAEDKTWRIINNEETLLIFDGLDEVSENVKSDILDILFDKQNVFKMTIVVTCRAGSPQLKMQVKDDSIFRGVSMRNEFWSKKITILGFNSPGAYQFLNNFVGNDDKDEIMPRLMEIVNSKEEMFKSPLMLILLVYLMREDHEIKFENNTDLYKQFAEYIIRQSIAKTNPAKEIVNFTLFDSSVNEYSSTFYKFGEMCWEQIFTNNLQFNPNADTEAIYQMGFLLKHETYKKFGILVHYEGFLSIMEFAAAVFLKKEFQENHNRFCGSLIKKIVEICVKKGSSSLVIPFLCGELGNDVASFFDQLSDNHVKYWITEELTESILQECVLNENINYCVEQIISSYFKMDKPSAVLAVASQQLRHGSGYYYCQNFFNVLETDLMCLIHITSPIAIRVLNFTAFESYIIPHQEIMLAAKNIKCESLICNIQYYLYYDTLSTTLKTFSVISSNHKTLRLRSRFKDIYTYLLKCVSNGVLTNTRFDLHVTIFNISGERDAITQIIEHNQITNLIIAIDDPATTFVADIFRSSAATNSLNSVCISNLDSNNEFRLNLQTIMKSTGKTLECLLVEDSRVKCMARPKYSSCIKSLSINAGFDFSSSVNDTDVMLAFTPRILRCKFNALQRLSTHLSASAWGGWASVVELTLTLTDLKSYECPIAVSDVSKFKNLKVLILDLTDQSPNKLIVANIIESLRLLKLNQLEIRLRNKCCYDGYDGIFQGVKILSQQNETILIEAVSFLIIWDKPVSEKKYGFDLESIKSALQCDFNIRFNFLFDDWEKLQTFVKIFIIDLLPFNIKYAFVERNVANIANVHLRNTSGSYLDSHILELTLR